MLSFKQCEKILNKNRDQKLTKQQIEQVSSFLWMLTNQSVEQFKNRKDETSSHNVQGK